MWLLGCLWIFEIQLFCKLAIIWWVGVCFWMFFTFGIDTDQWGLAFVVGFIYPNVVLYLLYLLVPKLLKLLFE